SRSNALEKSVRSTSSQGIPCRSATSVAPQVRSTTATSTVTPPATMASRMVPLPEASTAVLIATVGTLPVAPGDALRCSAGEGTLAEVEGRLLAAAPAALGPDPPTLCEGGTNDDLVAPLVVREHQPIAGLGIAVKPLAGWHDGAIDRAKQRVP